MNASSFASSPDAGRLVVGLVGVLTMAVLVAIWTLDALDKARRLSRALELRRQRAERRRLEALALHVSGRGTPARGMADGPQRARAAGVDELQLEDDFAGFAEYGGALRHGGLTTPEGLSCKRI